MDTGAPAAVLDNQLRPLFTMSKNFIGGLALSASSALESKENGSISGARNFKFLKTHWFCNTGRISITDSSGDHGGARIER